MDVDLRRTLPLHITWMVGFALVWLTIQDAGLSRLGRDSHAYWIAWRGETLYGSAPGTVDAYNYSPAFAQVVWPLAQLPWPVFGIAFSVAAAVALAYLFRPLGWAWVFPLLLCSAPEIISGNVFWLLALVAAYGLRPGSLWAGLWVVPLLTKLTPALGPIWFLVRREWRPFVVSAVVSALVIALSWAISPLAWKEWLNFLVENRGASTVSTGSRLFPPATYRLPCALVLLVWCAATNRRWGLPAAMVLATPVTGIAALTVLAALPRLYENEDHSPVHGRQSAAPGGALRRTISTAWRGRDADART